MLSITQTLPLPLPHHSTPLHLIPNSPLNLTHAHAHPSQTFTSSLSIQASIQSNLTQYLWIYSPPHSSASLTQALALRNEASSQQLDFVVALREQTL